MKMIFETFFHQSISFNACRCSYNFVFFLDPQKIGWKRCPKNPFTSKRNCCKGAPWRRARTGDVEVGCSWGSEPKKHYPKKRTAGTWKRPLFRNFAPKHRPKRPMNFVSGSSNVSFRGCQSNVFGFKGFKKNILVELVRWKFGQLSDNKNRPLNYCFSRYFFQPHIPLFLVSPQRIPCASTNSF